MIYYITKNYVAETGYNKDWNIKNNLVQNYSRLFLKRATGETPSKKETFVYPNDYLRRELPLKIDFIHQINYVYLTLPTMGLLEQPQILGGGGTMYPLLVTHVLLVLSS